MNMTKLCKQLAIELPLLAPKFVKSQDIEVEDHMIELTGCGPEFHVSGGPYGAAVVHESSDGFTFVDVESAADVIAQLRKWNAIPTGRPH